MSRMGKARGPCVTQVVPPIYNGYLNGLMLEDMSEEEKQLRWKLMKGWCPIFDQNYQMLLLDMFKCLIYELLYKTYIKKVFKCMCRA